MPVHKPIHLRFEFHLPILPRCQISKTRSCFTVSRAGSSFPTIQIVCRCMGMPMPWSCTIISPNHRVRLPYTPLEPNSKIAKLVPWFQTCLHTLYSSDSQQVRGNADALVPAPFICTSFPIPVRLQPSYSLLSRFGRICDRIPYLRTRT